MVFKGKIGILSTMIILNFKLNQSNCHVIYNVSKKRLFNLFIKVNNIVPEIHKNKLQIITATKMDCRFS